MHAQSRRIRPRGSLRVENPSLAFELYNAKSTRDFSEKKSRCLKIRGLPQVAVSIPERLDTLLAGNPPTAKKGRERGSSESQARKRRARAPREREREERAHAKVATMTTTTTTRAVCRLRTAASPRAAPRSTTTTHRRRTCCASLVGKGDNAHNQGEHARGRFFGRKTNGTAASETSATSSKANLVSAPACPPPACPMDHIFASEADTGLPLEVRRLAGDFIDSEQCSTVPQGWWRWWRYQGL